MAPAPVAELGIEDRQNSRMTTRRRHVQAALVLVLAPLVLASCDFSSPIATRVIRLASGQLNRACTLSEAEAPPAGTRP